MREIKFRALREHDKQFIYGSLVYLKNGESVILQKSDIERDGHHVMLDMDDMPTWFNTETIGQYAGLRDKNGKEIYEGDIVGVEDGILGTVLFGLYDMKYHCGFYIKWDKTQPFWRNDIGFWTRKREIEVIGNIYENPELLEVNNE